MNEVIGAHHEFHDEEFVAGSATVTRLLGVLVFALLVVAIVYAHDYWLRLGFCLPQSC